MARMAGLKRASQHLSIALPLASHYPHLHLLLQLFTVTNFYLLQWPSGTAYVPSFLLLIVMSVGLTLSS